MAQLGTFAPLFAIARAGRCRNKSPTKSLRMRRFVLLALPLIITAPLVAQMAKLGSRNSAAVTGGV